MTVFTGPTGDAEQRGRVYIDIYAEQNDPANNRTLVRVKGGIYDNNNSFGGFATLSWGLSFEGSNWSGSQYVDFTGASGRSYEFFNSNFWISHNTDGSRSVSGSVSTSATSPFGASSAGGSVGLTDYSRPPLAPATPTVSRSSDGTTMTVTSATADGRGLTITDYNYRWSSDGSNWSAAQAMGLSRTATFGPTSPTTVSPYQIFYFQTRAASSEGSGDWSATTSANAVPSVPTTISASRAARNVTVTHGSSASNGGGSQTVTYFAQYSSNNGSTWSAAVQTVNNAYEFTALTAGQTYLFRVYAQNSVGTNGFATTAPLFVPAGGRRWDGSSWNSTATAKRWTGSEWLDLTTAKRWSGSSWVDLS